MNKIQKSLSKLSPKEQKAVIRVVEQLMSGNWSGLDIVKLKGAAVIFRVRVGGIRIIFGRHGEKIDILAIERRSEKTYRNF